MIFIKMRYFFLYEYHFRIFRMTMRKNTVKSGVQKNNLILNWYRFKIK